MIHSVDPSFAGTYLRMAFCATVGMAGIAGNSPLPMNSNEVPLAWLQGIRIIMAIVAGYIPIFIYWCGRACPVTFLTCDIIIYRMFFMGNDMA